MAFNLRGNSVPDGSITEAKLAPNSVSSSKIQDDAVTVDKVEHELATQHFIGSEVELSHTGTVETVLSELHFVLNSGTDGEKWKSLAASINFKSNDVGNSASVRIRIDGTLFTNNVATNNTSYFLDSTGFVDISGLADGNHLIEIMAVNDQVTGITTVGQVEIYLTKKPT